MNIDVPTRSVEGLAALDVMYAEFNDVNFYVEDEDQENLYLTVIRKMLPDSRISKIFPLGGKKQVLDHAGDPVNAPSGKRSIYILDKDFDDLLGQMVFFDNVFYLDRYCIENYLIEESAVIDIVIESYPKLKPEEVEAQLQFKKFFSDSLGNLARLFYLFYLVQRHGLGIRNCKCAVEEFAGANCRWKILEEKISDYEEKVCRIAIERKMFASTDDMNDWIKGGFDPGVFADENISGKFLLALVHNYIAHHFSVKGLTHESFAYRLARNGTLRSLAKFAQEIRTYLVNGARERIGEPAVAGHGGPQMKSAL
ncbi:DUF4435 domain-containing protein [Rhizobacter sp. P5_C2]